MAKLTLAMVKAELSDLGMTISKRDGEFRVNFRGGHEDSACYTNDLNDARMTGDHMARHGAFGAEAV